MLPPERCGKKFATTDPTQNNNEARAYTRCALLGRVGFLGGGGRVTAVSVG